MAASMFFLKHEKHFPLEHYFACDSSIQTYLLQIDSFYLINLV